MHRRRTYYDSDPQKMEWIRCCSQVSKVASQNSSSYIDLHRQYHNLMYDFFFEAQVMSHQPLCQHPNVVKLLGLSFYTINEEIIYPILIVEAADSQYPDLRRYIDDSDRQRPISVSTLIDIAADIADGLDAIHQFGLIHGDVKPENILLFQGVREKKFTAKIADFGFSGSEVSGDVTRGFTRIWNDPHSTKTTSSNDIYSFGLICAYLVHDGVQGPEVIRNMEDGELWGQRMREPQLDCLIDIIRSTLRPLSERLQSLSGVRNFLFGT